VLLGAFGYALTLALGPVVALFLVAATREDDDPWTRRDTITVGALFLAYLAAGAVGDGGFPASELLHTGLAWRLRGSPGTARGCGMSTSSSWRNARCGTSARRSVSGCWRWPRSALGLPATCMTPPAMPST
jgi:hypothetical protein